MAVGKKGVLLAPVPRDHIASAREKALQTGGRVAFGTGANDPGRMWEFFTTKVKPGMDVLIYVSTTGTGEYYGHVFSHAAKFERIVATEREVLDLRPESAIATDTGRGCYWVVSGLVKLNDTEFIKFEDMKINPPLLGPRIS